MTINEMLKKVAAYNELSEMIGTRFGQKVELMMTDHGVVNDYHFAKNLKEFKHTINETYIKCIADAILGYKGYEFNTPVDITVIDAFGDKLTTTVEFGVCAE